LVTLPKIAGMDWVLGSVVSQLYGGEFTSVWIGPKARSTLGGWVYIDLTGYIDLSKFA